MLRARAAVAFAPAAISNFFSIHASEEASESSDLSRVGATGGGYVLPVGVTTKATVIHGEGRGAVETVVDGDPKYDARTTRRAVALMLADAGPRFSRLVLEQTMGVPVGQGFGSSAASALSAVFATAKALDLSLAREEVAYYAHAAEILEQTGLGTVSVTFDAVGAGAITLPGGPGISAFVSVEVPAEIRIVTASLGPYRKEDAVSSTEMREKISRLGDESLKEFMAAPSLERLAATGESFSANLGLMTDDLHDLAGRAKAAGASFASQNMIGLAIHAITPADRVDDVVGSLKAAPSNPTVAVFRVGNRKAGVVSSAEVDYPTVTSSFG